MLFNRKINDNFVVIKSKNRFRRFGRAKFKKNIFKVYLKFQSFDTCILLFNNCWCIYNYTNNYFFLIFFKFFKFFYFISARCFIFLVMRSFYFISWFFWFIRKILVGLLSIFFCKIKYRGKFYKIYRSKLRGTLKLRFGYAHLIYLYVFFVSYKILTKNFLRPKILLTSYNYFDLIATAYNIRNWQPVNMYTSRGIRLKKQPILHKLGKISQKISKIIF